jgi:hypothetical protein
MTIRHSRHTPGIDVALCAERNVTFARFPSEIKCPTCLAKRAAQIAGRSKWPAQMAAEAKQRRETPPVTGRGDR